MHPLSIDRIRAGDQPRALDGMIYDLYPWDDGALDVITTVTQWNQPTPMLLYPPTHISTVGALLVRAGALRADLTAMFQDGQLGEIDRLRQGVRLLVTKAPKVHLRAVMQRCCSTMPPLVEDYLNVLLDIISHGDARLDVSIRSIACRMKSTTRTLERACKDALLPTPKELSAWIMLVWLAFQADRRGIPMSSVARRYCINANQLYRLRHRLLGGASEKGEKRSSKGLDDIVRAFAERCRSD